MARTLAEARQARLDAERAGDTGAWVRARAVELHLMQEGVDFDPLRHPRDRRGRWRETFGALARETGLSARKLFGRHDAGTAHATLGVTPYHKRDDPGYPRRTFASARGLFDERAWTRKWQAFESDVDSLARQHGVRVISKRRTVGLWEGKFEPSYSIVVDGKPDAIDSFNAALGSKWDQDAVVGFRPDDNGPDANVELGGASDPDQVFRSLKSLGIEGATFSPDGSSISVFVDGNDEPTVNKLIRYAQAHDMVLRHTPGFGSYIGLQEARMAKKSPVLAALEAAGSKVKPATGTSIVVRLGK